MDSVAIDSRLQWALEGSQRAADLILRYYQIDNLAVEFKADESPVTVADRGAEELLRAEIERLFPQDGILGEELGTKSGSSGFQWILDPIDGTKSFVHGTPLFGTLIGLLYQDNCVAGVCRFPATGEVVYASRGEGAWWQSSAGELRQARVRSTNNLAQATFCYTAIDGWIQVKKLASLERLVRTCKIARGWGDCYGHMLVATGRADVMIDPLLNPWDAAALIPIVEEAGGVFMDWTGHSTIHGGNGISTISPLREAVLSIL